MVLLRESRAKQKKTVFVCVFYAKEVWAFVSHVACRSTGGSPWVAQGEFLPARSRGVFFFFFFLPFLFLLRLGS